MTNTTATLDTTSGNTVRLAEVKAVLATAANAHQRSARIRQMFGAADPVADVALLIAFGAAVVFALLAHLPM